MGVYEGVSLCKKDDKFTESDLMRLLGNFETVKVFL
jgi:hypothetical protein